jgi:hypothetical protein
MAVGKQHPALRLFYDSMKLLRKGAFIDANNEIWVEEIREDPLTGWRLRYTYPLDTTPEVH